MNSKMSNLLVQTYMAFEKYYVKLKKENKFIFAYMEVATREEFLELSKEEYSTIVIEEVTRKKKYTLIECQKYGYETDNEITKIKYRVDRIFDGVFIDLNKKIINEVTLSFDDINWFFNDENSYDFDPCKACVNTKGFNLEYSTTIGKIQIFKSFSLHEINNTFNISNDIVFNLIFDKAVDYYELRKLIYCFRNLLLILGRRNINIISIKINNTELYDCYEEYNYNPINKKYMEYLDHHTLTINSIENFSDVVTKFIDIYDSIISIIDSYFCQVKYSLPSKVKFINTCVMIEDYANLFFAEEAKRYREVEATQNKKKYITNSINKMIEQKIISENDADKVNSILAGEVKKDMNLTFKEKVMSIIKNVNDSFKFDDEEIELISDNFRNARKQFIHKGAFADEEICQFLNMYCLFTEDVIYLNILKKIGIDIKNSIFNCIEYNYEKDNLIIKFI